MDPICSQDLINCNTYELMLYILYIHYIVGLYQYINMRVVQCWHIYTSLCQIPLKPSSDGHNFERSTIVNFWKTHSPSKEVNLAINQIYLHCCNTHMDEQYIFPPTSSVLSGPFLNSAFLCQSSGCEECSISLTPGRSLLQPMMWSNLISCRM